MKLASICENSLNLRGCTHHARLASFCKVRLHYVIFIILFSLTIMVRAASYFKAKIINLRSASLIQKIIVDFQSFGLATEPNS